MKAFKAATRIVRDGKHYGLCCLVGSGVFEMSEAEQGALPEVDMTPRELRICGQMLMDLALAHDDFLRQLTTSDPATAARSATAARPASATAPAGTTDPA